MPELDRISVLRNALADHTSWLHVVEGPPGSGKRTGAIQIIADVLAVGQTPILVVASERHLSSYQFLLEAMGIFADRPHLYEMLEFLSARNPDRQVTKVFLMSSNFVAGSRGRIAIDRCWSLIVIDEVPELAQEAILSFAQMPGVERLLVLTRHELDPRLLEEQNQLSKWPSLEAQYAPVRRKVHNYTATATETDIKRRIGLFLETVSDSEARREIAKAASSSHAALEAALLSLFADQSGRSDFDRKTLSGVVEALAFVMLDSRIKAIVDIIIAVDATGSPEPTFLLLGDEIETLTVLQRALEDSGRTVEFFVRDGKYDVIKLISIATWDAITDLDLEPVTDVVLVDFPASVPAWRDLQSALLRPSGDPSVTVHALMETEVDPYTSERLRAFEFVDEFLRPR